MKKTIKVLGLIALVAVIGFLMFACGGGGNGGEGNGGGNGGGGNGINLAGTTWECTESYYGVMTVTYTLTFTASTVKMDYLYQTVNGTYYVNGSSIIINWEGGYTGYGSFTISGNRLTSSEGNVFIKQ
jgi:hypothetical protein